MTVAELIARLSSCGPDLVVYTEDYEEGMIPASMVNEQHGYGVGGSEIRVVIR